MRTILLTILSLITAATTAFALPVFEGCAGFGCETPGGSGRHLSPPQTAIIRVTTLNDSGPGSLRECLEAKVPRTCLCEVGGYADLTRSLTVSSPYLSFFGSACPSPGLHIRNARLVISASDVFIQDLGLRPGDGAGDNPTARDAVVIWKTSLPLSNVVLDRNSLTFALDENFSTFQPLSNLTVSRTLIAEGLYQSAHPEGPHSMGALLDSKATNVTFFRNIFANNKDRHPRMKSSITLEFLNNYVFNLGGFTGWNYMNMSSSASDPANKINFLGNVYRRGGASQNDFPCVYDQGVQTATRIFAVDNVCPAGRVSNLAGRYFVDTPAFPLSGAPVMGTGLLLPVLLRTAGARAWDRFPLDSRILDELEVGQGTLKGEWLNS